MSAEGPSFDGITDQAGGGSSIVDNKATNYIATNTSDQYATDKSNLDFVANSATPVFSFKNNDGIAGELRVSKITLTQPSTLVTSSGGLTLQNNDTTPVLTVQKNTGLTPTGVSASISNNSQTDAPLTLTNQNANSNTGLQVLAPNITTGQKTSITLGKDISNNGNSYTLSSIYSTTDSDKRFEINSFGETTPVIKAYKQATTSTSATTGSVVVPGDLTSSTKVSSKALVLYSSSSGSASLNAPSVISTPYTLTLPNALGTFGQVLTIGTPSGNTAQTSWSTVQSTVTASGVFSRQILNQQTVIPGNYSAIVVFDGPASVNTIGTVPITLQSDNFTFKNTAGYKTAFNVSYTVVWASNADNTAIPGIKQAWISKNLNFDDRYGFTTTTHVVGQSQTLEATATIVLEPNETFGIRVYQATGVNQKINNAGSEMTKIQITQVQGTVPPEVGIQTLALTTPSSLFTISGSPASGSNPTISFTTTTTPTGSGETIALANSPTISSPTLSGTTTITGNAILSGQSTIAEAVVTKFVEGATVVNTTNSGTLTLSNQSETSWIFKSNGTSYSVKLPSEPTINIGSKYKFVNQTINDISIRNANNTLLYTLKAKAKIECLMVSTEESVYSWRFIPVLHNTITSTPESFKIGKGYGIYGEDAPPEPAKLVLGNVSDNTISIYPHSSQTSNYDFILPTNMGTSGQVLTSQGTGNPLAWSESLNNLSVLNITTTGNTISNNSGEVLTISGQSRPFTVQNTAATGNKITSMNMTPNLFHDGSGANANVMIQGKELAPNQCIYQNFNYLSPNSNLNYWSLGLYLKDPTIEVREANLPFQQAKQSFTVYGGIESTYLKTQNFQITNAANTIYNTTGSTTPNLTLITQANSNTPLKIVNNSSSTNTIAELTAPNLSATQSTFLWIGKDFSQNGNMGYLAYSYQNAPSAQNELALGYNNAGSSLIIRKPFQNADNDATSSVRVNGGLVCDSFRATGSISGQIQTSNLTTTSAIKFDKGNGQIRNFNFDYGSSTPTFWWAYNTTDKSCTFSYPSVGEQIANRQYYWQQTGYQYSFYLQLKVEITSSDTLPVVFINNCNPPEPVCGPYVVTEGAPYLPGQSPVPNGLGLYIPAT